MTLAPTYFISQSALILLLLLSKSNPLRWASIWVWVQSRKVQHLYCFHVPKKRDTTASCPSFSIPLPVVAAYYFT